MASRFNTLLHGEASEAADVLSGDCRMTERESIVELRAALTNALRRIDRFERRWNDKFACVCETEDIEVCPVHCQ